MAAVIYARYSSDNQREESIEGQIRECTAYAEKNGFTVVKHYIDHVVSAKTDNRPQFQQMIKDSERGIFDVIIVWKLDRFARNRYDSARYKTQLKRNGVKLVSATEVISAGPEGIILESVLEGYAEYYSADLSEKVVRGMTENHQYAERHPDGHPDQLHKGAAGSSGRTAEGTASPHRQCPLSKIYRCSTVLSEWIICLPFFGDVVRFSLTGHGRSCPFLLFSENAKKFIREKFYAS